MRRAAALWLLMCTAAAAQVTTRDDAVGKLLNDWYKAGSGAGLDAFTYENRDGGHSLLPLPEWPQLKLYEATEEEKRLKQNMGPAGKIRPIVLFGNCSMAAPADKGGSLPRLYYNAPTGSNFLVGEYLNNNLMFYPCHQDHDRGWNGVGGWGDLYPTNTACCVISQGSSFTDQPFLRAFLGAAAALPTETQSVLIRSRALIPTLQSLFRQSNTQVKSDEDYFTGAAHPPVFRGDQIDAEKFARLAHALAPPAVPPVAVLQVLKEAPACVPDRDFFELPALTDENLANTPCVIARLFRSSVRRHELLVSARHSMDMFKSELSFKWVLLQGDPGRVKIETSPDGAEAKITVAWHPEMRTAAGLATHRVDIGVFVGNKLGWSAPAFITFFMLPNEQRFYREDGQPEEICYEAGNPDTGVPVGGDLRWLSLGRHLETNAKALGIRLLLQALPPDVVKTLRATADEFADRQREWRALDEDPDKKKEADSFLQALRQDIRTRLEAPLGGTTARDAVEKAVLEIADTPDLFVSLQEPLATLAREGRWVADFENALKRAVEFGALNEVRPGQYALRFKPGDLSAGDRAQLRSLHLVVLATALLPEFLERSNQPAWADARLSLPKSWRDVYVYDKAGTCLGWSRLANGQEYDFDAIGRLLPQGRNGPAVEVKYLRDSAGGHLVFAPK